MNPWLLLQRGAHREREDVDGKVVGEIADEVTQRSQLADWKQLMLQP